MSIEQALVIILILQIFLDIQFVHRITMLENKMKGDEKND